MAESLFSTDSLGAYGICFQAINRCNTPDYLDDPVPPPHGPTITPTAGGFTANRGASNLRSLKQKYLGFPGSWVAISRLTPSKVVGLIILSNVM